MTYWALSIPVVAEHAATLLRLHGLPARRADVEWDALPLWDLRLLFGAAVRTGERGNIRHTNAVLSDTGPMAIGPVSDRVSIITRRACSTVPQRKKPDQIRSHEFQSGCNYRVTLIVSDISASGEATVIRLFALLITV
jgi:hypothetical protein